MNTKLIEMKTRLAVGAVMAFVTVLFLCGCSSVRVTTDYDHTADFGKFRTYALEPPRNVPPLSPSLDAAVRSTLSEGLAARGIREVGGSDRPDLAVVPHLRTERRYSLQQYTTWGYGPGVWPYAGGFYGMWYGAPMTYNTITTYTEGTLVLDFVDTSNQRLVFRGTGTGTVSNNPERNARKITDAVERIVARFPATQSQPIAGNYEPATTAAAAP